MQIIEHNNHTLKTDDLESRVFIFSAKKDSYKNLIDFGRDCISLKDEDGDFYVSRWKSPEYQIIAVSEKVIFETLDVVKDFICNNITNGARITKAFSFWDDWNNRFQVIEVDSTYYGIAWWTTV